MAVLYLDLDRFKSVNDTLGHDVGDELLIETARRLQNLCRTSDTVARLGGDEFVFILDDIHTRDDAAVVARKIIASMARPLELRSHTLTISTSIGIGVYPDDARNKDDVVKCADMALYAAKKSGRNDYRFCSGEMPSQCLDKQRLETEELRNALQEEQFLTFFQPLYNLVNERITGFEAMLYWDHPQRGRLPAEEFLPLAQGSDLLRSLGCCGLQHIARAWSIGWLQACGNLLLSV